MGHKLQVRVSDDFYERLDAQRILEGYDSMSEYARLLFSEGLARRNEAVLDTLVCIGNEPDGTPITITLRELRDRSSIDGGTQ